MLGRLVLFALSAVALSACDSGTTRPIRAVGSSTVFPFTTAVAEAFVNQDKRRAAPVIESIGSGAGFRAFCEGVGSQYPDIANASRRMKRTEYDLCQKNNVGEILEVQIGLDGVVLAESNAGPRLKLTRKDLYLALAANPMGKPNAAKTWKDVNPALPAIPIYVMGPPSTSGTRDAFTELMLEPGCLEAYPEAKALKAGADPAKFQDACLRIRDDGPYVDKGENDNLIVQGLSQNPNALGIFGYSYLEENIDRLHGTPIEGVEPTNNEIVTGKYPGGRPLYIYVKQRHIKAVRGMQDFLNLYATMWKPKGELTKRGLIAAPSEVQEHSAEIIEKGIALDPSQLH
ncbi:substrate-binding domain-containing protein [Nostoc ellipsosporum NOK]|uniref:substrate-binding domain-containing protein n=1 Tax=Sphingomonas sp. IBVSS2 TaxID=1985172 RepID=UPI000A2E5389|nr:substrate-binding domain-containing protein [Sphingomonas sp. IBVSS2]MDF2384432.1 substrate-binding domain-containing protein [Nostoc ellipsosporum NOK]OSZ68438.1 phosphate ABC transporter substrate-binding protein [Sphingomonas sp. IBVSS2]